MEVVSYVRHPRKKEGSEEEREERKEGEEKGRGRGEGEGYRHVSHDPYPQYEGSDHLSCTLTGFCGYGTFLNDSVLSRS